VTDYVLDTTTPTAPPWAAEHFQVQKNGTRYYADTRPSCDLIADPHAEPVPGFSSLKASKPFRKSVTIGEHKYTVPLDWHRAIEWIISAGFDVDGAPTLEPFYQSANVQRDRDFARGHAIHAAAEAALVGQGVLNVNPDAEPYIPHLVEWIERNVTDVHAIEAVVFGDGYGGTGDAWVNVRGVSVYLDWKSRGADSSHGIYEEEVCQGGAYTSARYCILPTDDRQGAVRAPVPAASHGLVLSIRPDGVQEFWYDLNKAQEAFASMHDAYRSTSQSGKLARAAKVKDPTGTVATSQRMKKATPAPAVTPTVAPTEGDTVDVAELRDRYVALDPAAKTWVDAKRAEALKAGCDFHLKDNYTQRRHGIMTGLVTLAEVDAGDETLALLVEPYAPTVYQLNHHTAQDFADACKRYVGQPVTTDRITELFGATEHDAA
jgi:hypothetical protein